MSHRPIPLALFVSLACLSGCDARRAEPSPLVEPALDQHVELTQVVEPPPPDVEPVGLGVIEARLYPPDLVMDHQAEIALTPEQREAILEEVRRTQTELVELDASLRGSVETLQATLDAPTIDEPAAMTEIEGVMAQERQIKAAHFRMLLRIRAQLTEAQRAQLDALRER